MYRHMLIAAVLFLVYLDSPESASHSVVKRQAFGGNRGAGRRVPFRGQQFPPPEEPDEEELNFSPETPQVRRRPANRRPTPRTEEPEEIQPEEIQPEEFVPATPAPPPRSGLFNTRRSPPRFGGRPQQSTSSSAPTPAPSSPAPRVRGRFTPRPTENTRRRGENSSPAPPASPFSGGRQTSSFRSRPAASSSQAVSSESSPPDTSNRRRRPARRRSTTTTTTTTTTTEEPEYYYDYIEDEEEPTTTTTTTTRRPRARRPAGPRVRPVTRPTSAPPRRLVYNPDDDIRPPEEDYDYPEEPPQSRQKFTPRSTTSTTTTTTTPRPRNKNLRPRTDGRYIDWKSDPNFPRELNGVDLTDYPFYITLPEDIDFPCDEKHDGFYADVPHHCQVFHYCFGGIRYSFLCANYTLYDQTTFTCRFVNDVNCAKSELFYDRNNDLYVETTTLDDDETTTPKSKKKKNK